MLHATIGVDVSKDWLDAHRLPDGAGRRFPNSTSGHRALIAWIGETPVERLAFEPTGAYHRALERALAEAGVAVVEVNPLQARRFAEAIGQRAETDPVDALMLARMVALLDPKLRPPTSEALHELRELHGARLALIKDRTDGLIGVVAPAWGVAAPFEMSERGRCGPPQASQRSSRDVLCRVGRVAGRDHHLRGRRSGADREGGSGGERAGRPGQCAEAARSAARAGGHGGVLADRLAARRADRGRLAGDLHRDASGECGDEDHAQQDRSERRPGAAVGLRGPRGPAGWRRSCGRAGSGRCM